MFSNGSSIAALDILVQYQPSSIILHTVSAILLGHILYKVSPK